MRQPPKWARELLFWRVGNADAEDIIGDLDEVYYDQLEAGRSPLKAGLSYWNQVFHLIFSYGLEKRRSKAALSPYYFTNHFNMFKNYLKIAIRNFSKHKLFTIINIGGLALGMCICLLALTLSVAIYRSDDFHANKDRIYQLNTYLGDESKDKTYASTFLAIGAHLKENYPFAEEVVDIRSDFNVDIRHFGNDIPVRGYMTASGFFDLFDFQMIDGDPTTALEQPFSIVLTENIAERLYRDEDPLGKTLEINQESFTVTGVIENPKQTHLAYEVLVSYSTYGTMADNPENDWINFKNHYVYVMLREGVKKQELDHALTNMAEIATEFHLGKTVKFESMVLTGVVPRWNISNSIGIGWDQPSLIFFLTIGFLVLLPAIFNYTNLSIARALKRAKEIGIRKVVGAEKAQIKSQFVVETVVMALLALIGSFFIMLPLKREFLDMVWKSQVLDTDPDFYQITTYVFFAIVVGLIAGLFPAQYFSRLNPMQTLKGEIKDGKNQVTGLKKGLFVFQFFLSLVFIIGVTSLARQYRYVLNENHGFESENILVVPFKGMDRQIVMTELAKHPAVTGIAATSGLPGVGVQQLVDVTSNDQDTIKVKQVFIEREFLDLMDMRLSWGDHQLDASNQTEELVLVNERFLQAISVFNEQKDTLRFTLADGTHCRIAGVLEEANFEPLSETIQPLVFRDALEKTDYALIKLASADIQRTLTGLELAWEEIDRESHFEATFLDAEIEDAYYFLQVQIKFFTVLSTLAITISCLGLLGMVTFSTENRTKEIAVRKIMGASNSSLYYLLTRDFIKLVGISALIAIPFSYFFYDKIFLYFIIQYGTGLGFVEVLLSVLFLVIVGFLSIYWQTSKVAKSNPATKLRYE